MTRAQVIVNGDDFGISEAVNEGIIRAFRGGVLTSCSLMVTGAAFAHAVGLARRNPALAVGLHLVTVCGNAVLPHHVIPSLVDTTGRFSSNPTAAGLHYFFSPDARKALGGELTAQFERFRATGLPCAHVDSHLHMHVHPVIFELALKLGLRFGVRRMRVPREPLRIALRFSRGGRAAKAAYALIFHALTARMQRRLREAGMGFTRCVYGNILSGNLSEDYFLAVLDALPPGPSEIYLHPALHTGALGPEEHRRQAEYDLLMSRRVLNRMEQLGIERMGTLESEVNA